MTRIWFDHYLLLEDVLTLLRNDPETAQYTYIGSHSDSVRLQSTSYDESYLCNKVPQQDYVVFALEFCKQHNVDVFSPRYNQGVVMQHKAQFDQLGISLMIAAESDVMDLLDNKESTFELASLLGFYAIPEYHVVRTAYAFREAVLDLQTRGRLVCFKPVNAEGGRGFWEVAPATPPTIEHLLQSKSSDKSISLENAQRILSQQNLFEPVMVMEKLTGTEYSVDCIATEGKLDVAVIREKPMNTYVRKIIDHPQIIQLVQELTQIFVFNGAYNIQFIARENEDELPLLLEINPRFSGGVALSSLSGVNLPKLAIRLALTGTVGEVPPPVTGLTVNQIKRGIIINERNMIPVT